MHEFGYAVIMKNRIVAEMALEQKTPPRQPVALIAGGEWYVNAAGKTFGGIKEDPQQIADVFIRGYHSTRPDLMWTGGGLLNYPVHFLGCPIVDQTSDSPALGGTVISRPEELPTLRIETVTENPTLQGMLAAHHLVADAIGGETLIMPTLWGPFTTAARILGTEAVMMASVADTDGLRRLVDFATEMLWALADSLLAHPDLRGLNLSEPVASGDMISPVTFRRLVLPCLRVLRDRVKARGKFFSLHICGDTTRILPDILDLKPDCFSLEAKVDLSHAREVLGGKVCVLGNVSPTGAFLTGDPAAVAAEAGACVEAWGRPDGFILSVGCDFPKQVPLANIQALLSLRSAWGEKG